MQHRSHLSVTVIGLVVAIGLAACNGGSAGSSSIAHPGGDALVFRIATTGGFVAPEVAFTTVPEFTLLGDGRLIEPGAVDMIYPGPAILPLLERRLSEAGVQEVLREVEATGIFTGDRAFNGAQGLVADAGTTSSRSMRAPAGPASRSTRSVWPSRGHRTASRPTRSLHAGFSPPFRAGSPGSTAGWARLHGPIR